MTRLESIKTQVLELTRIERQELAQWIDHIPEPQMQIVTSPEMENEDDVALAPEQLNEIHSRIAEFRAGTSVMEDKETFFRLLEESLPEHRS